jgi:hypothetical protein
MNIKKILSAAFMTLVLSIVAVEVVNARMTSEAEEVGTRRTTRRAATKRTRKGSSRGKARRRGGVAKVQDTADALQEAAKIARTTKDPVEKKEAIKTANELAQELLASIQDERTWSQDLGISKYTEDQVNSAITKLGKLNALKVGLENDIKEKENYIQRVSKRSWVFWTKVREGEKEEDLDKARKELAELRTSLKNINKSIRDQSVIAGAEYSNTIKGAITALTAATIAGAAYGIDTYFELGYTEAAGKAISDVRKNIKDKGIFTYGKELVGEGYDVIKKAVDYGFDKLDDLKLIITSQFSANQGLQRLAKQATKAQEEAGRLLSIAEETNKQKDIDAAAKQQEMADTLGAELEKAVADAQAKAEAKK